MCPSEIESTVRWFENVSLSDLPEVGGKIANLGELHHLAKQGRIRVANGFCITAAAYRDFIRNNGLEVEINRMLQEKSGPEKIRKMIRESSLPEKLMAEVTIAYDQLTRSRNGRMDVAVRSSATAEDLPTASFAGLQDSFLNINGIHDLLEAVRNCFASLFNDRAVSYRNEKRIHHDQVDIAVAVQEMIRSDLSVSGVMFTIDTETGFENHILIESSYGLGESIVQGKVSPDEFIVAKNLLKPGKFPIIRMKPGTKEHKLVYDFDGASGTTTRTETVSVPDRNRFSLSEPEIIELANQAAVIERHYQEIHGKKSPMDIEWAKDGISGEFIILQARPETVHSVKLHESKHWQQHTLLEKGRILIQGSSVGNSIQSGVARVIDSARDLSLLKWGEVLVTDRTDPDWEPAMKKAAAIVTNRGGRTCHAAIVARELGIPAVVGTGNATQVIRSGQKVTVSSGEGSVGRIYEGELKFRISAIPEVDLTRLKTRIMMNLGDPDAAAGLSFLPNHGIGLARLEFIINSAIGVHPMAIARFDSISDENIRKKIVESSKSFDSPKEFFIRTLSCETGMIAAAFYPKTVVVRFSDFKSNEYSRLIGGELFEHREENPMIGFRGAGRYLDDDYRDGFLLECEAMIRAREHLGLDNISLMIPFCRTVEEAERILSLLSSTGISRERGYSILMMCEIPSNVILAKEFLSLFDGFSIGSNDLTQLTLGIDRDSEKAASSFSERNPAVLALIRDAIIVAKELNKPIGICGQAPSDDPEFARFIVECGIDSISLNPDSVLRTIPIILEAEKRRQTGFPVQNAESILPKPPQDARTSPAS